MKQRKQKKRDILGGYSAGAPPLPIPNREVKPGRADGTAPQCGRVGRRPLFEERDALRRRFWGVPPTVFVFLCVCVCVCVCFPVVLLLPSGLSFSSGFCGRGVEGCGGAATDRTGMFTAFLSCLSMSLTSFFFCSFYCFYGKGLGVSCLFCTFVIEI